MSGKIRFGVYELDRDAMELRKHGVLIRMQEQPFRVLAILSGRPGEIITREELQEQIWEKDTFVDFDQSLNKAVNRVREALNDDAGTPQYVETVPRRGYRFVAPVTGNTPNEPGGTTASAVSDADVRKSGRHRFSFVKSTALAMAGLLVALGIASVLFWRKPRKPEAHETRHMTSAGFGPALSRDGKLLAYVSTLGGDVMHIWVQQTAGGEAIPVTSGPDADYWPDFSPDGTHMAFISTRGGGGIYVGPTLPGEPRLVVRRPLYIQGTTLKSPRFSPSGDRILYWEDDSKAMIVPVDDGQPVSLSLNRDFRVDGPPRWSPGGDEIIFYGVRKSDEMQNVASGWIAPLNGGEPRPVRLPKLEESDEESHADLAWIRTEDGREWIVYAVASGGAWRLLRVGISARGQIDEKPEQVVWGEGEPGHSASVSEDGKVAYVITRFSESIYEIRTDEHGQKLGPTLQLPLAGEGDQRSPSVSWDGHWMVYDATRPGKPNTVLLRELGGGADRVLDDRGRRPGSGGATSISPDGSKAIFERDCKNGRFNLGGEPLPCGFMVLTTGGQPEQICEYCTPRGFASNGSVVLIQKYVQTGSDPHDRIVAVDLSTKAEKDFLSVPGKDLYHAFFSRDDRWVVFKQLLGFTKAKILIAPVRNGAAGKENEWITVTDGRYSDDKPQFSPDGNTIYFTSTRDGYLCIWTQGLDPKSKRPLGAPVAYEHFHNSIGRDASNPDWQRGSDLTVATDKILINLPEVRDDIWMMQPE